MGSMWSDALRRASEALGRRRRAAQSEGGETTEESGFTLIELMVVLLIMGILMAIAIPTFLGVTSVANDRSTQSNLTNVLTSAKAMYAQSDGFAKSATAVKTLGKQDNAFKYTTGASSKQGTISVDTPAAGTTVTGKQITMAAWMTKTNVCWFVNDVESGTHPGVVYGYSAALTKTTCKATSFITDTYTKVTKTTATPSTTATVYSTKWPTAPTGK